MKNLTQLIEKARNLPALAPIHTLEIDRQLRGKGHPPITFSAHGLSESSNATARQLKLEHLFSAPAKPESANAIYQAEMLVKGGKRSEAIAHAFVHAQGPQVNGLNLFYANHWTQRPALRCYFLNKYLSAYGLRIELEQDESTDFFHRLKSGITFEKVDGPLVTVIMPAHNAEATIELALNSLLNQSWHNLQILIVDDASTDSTLQKAKAIAKRDPRVEVLSNPVNVGPYVSRNLGVLYTRGEWLTVHDADDWAFPDRIEQQVKALTDAKAHTCTGGMLRMNAQGQITRPSPLGGNNEDGYQRRCFVSLMVQTEVFRKELGAWDSVRVGGDAEMIARLKVVGIKGSHLGRPLMLCLDHAAGLTNHVELGLVDEDGRMRQVRSDYKKAYEEWHQSPGSKKLSPYAESMVFDVLNVNRTKKIDIEKVFAQRKKDIELIKSSKLFNEGWYGNKYPFAIDSGWTAAEHYLTHGGVDLYDPGPSFSSKYYFITRVGLRSGKSANRLHNPLIKYLHKGDGGVKKDVIFAADALAKEVGYTESIQLASRDISSELEYSLSALRANASLEVGNINGWLAHVNAILAHYGMSPIEINPGSSLINRLTTKKLKQINDGPLVSIIMPAWNAEIYLFDAAMSILNQTWNNIELLIVDDASTDSTWAVCNKIAKLDSRVKIFRNKINVGPYVSKNIGLNSAQGAYITGHDADDWAHPQRIEKHLSIAIKNNLKASITYMIRVSEDGKLSHLCKIREFSPDGVVRKSSISCLFERSFLKDTLGYWDSVRFAADSEMISRATLLLNDKFQCIRNIGMICLDHESSLTNDPVHGVRTEIGLSAVRSEYRKEWLNWHNDNMTADNAFIEFPQKIRRYAAHPSMVVPYDEQLVNICN